MLSEKKIKKLADYWINNSKEKLNSMKKLYESKCYADALYYGHMILEMILKAHVVMKTKKPALKIHNLRRLYEISGMELEIDDIKLMVKVNEFNMETRYPDEKMEFYKLCTKSYTDKFYGAIINLHKRLCQKVK
ncbi:MAG: HEPN domain-containing protein [Patescibacteria group bacterium]